MRDTYELKMRQQGGTGLERVPGGDPLSKLYVLIWADREATARQIGWILHAAAQQRFYKCVFGVRVPASGNAAPCIAPGDHALQVFLPTSNRPAIVSREGPDIAGIHVYVDSGRLSLSSTEARDAAALTRLVASERQTLEADEHRKIIVFLHVGPGVTHGRLVEAVNAIQRAQCEKIDFVGLDPPADSTRLYRPLPR